MSKLKHLLRGIKVTVDNESALERKRDLIRKYSSVIAETQRERETLEFWVDNPVLQSVSLSETYEYDDEGGSIRVLNIDEVTFVSNKERLAFLLEHWEDLENYITDKNLSSLFHYLKELESRELDDQTLGIELDSLDVDGSSSGYYQFLTEEQLYEIIVIITTHQLSISEPFERPENCEQRLEQLLDNIINFYQEEGVV